MRTITVSLPMSAIHALIGLRVTTPAGVEYMTFSKIHKTAEIEVPEGVTEDEIEIVGGVCDARGQWDEGVESVVLHAAKQPESRGEETAGSQIHIEDVTTKDPPKVEVIASTSVEQPKPTVKRVRPARSHETQTEAPTEKPVEAAAETNEADKPAQPHAEAAAGPSAK